MTHGIETDPQRLDETLQRKVEARRNELGAEARFAESQIRGPALADCIETTRPLAQTRLQVQETVISRIEQRVTELTGNLEFILSPPGPLPGPLNDENVKEISALACSALVSSIEDLTARLGRICTAIEDIDRRREV